MMHILSQLLVLKMKATYVHSVLIYCNLCMAKTVRIFGAKKRMLNKDNVVFNIRKRQILASLFLGEKQHYMIFLTLNVIPFSLHFYSYPSFFQKPPISYENLHSPISQHVREDLNSNPLNTKNCAKFSILLFFFFFCFSFYYYLLLYLYYFVFPF